MNLMDKDCFVALLFAMTESDVIASLPVCRQAEQSNLPVSPVSVVLKTQAMQY